MVLWEYTALAEANDLVPYVYAGSYWDVVHHSQLLPVAGDDAWQTYSFDEHAQFLLRVRDEAHYRCVFIDGDDLSHDALTRDHSAAFADAVLETFVQYDLLKPIVRIARDYFGSNRLSGQLLF